MKDITIGQYYPVNSKIHSLDPRCKIICSILMIVFVFVEKSFTALGISCLFVFLCAAIAHIPAKKMLAGLKGIYIIIGFTFLLNTFFYNEGAILLSLGFVKVTYGGLERAVFMALRLIMLIMSASLLTFTTTPIEITDGLENLMSPLKKIGFPAHEIAMMMSIALRFIPTLTEETDKIMKAQMSRGANFDEGSVFARAKAVVSLLIPLLVSSFRRADELAMAMESRCYTGGEGRTRLKELKMSGQDACAFAIVIMFCLIILADAIWLFKVLP